ncbi:MAG: hypothetical protein Q8M95_15050 [Candidatus Methanoperedens sp.]|nr:hypothetical protein [Candidatus Methanoperedens sp.]
MIVSGQSMQSIAGEIIYPFLNDLVRSDDESEAREALSIIKILADKGAERKNLLGLQKALCHKNRNIACTSLDILRKSSPIAGKMIEVDTNVWKSMFPFFCERTLTASPGAALDSLKILDALIDHNIVGDYKDLQKALLHENDNVANLALEALRKIAGLTIESRVEKVKQQPSANKMLSPEVPQQIQEMPTPKEDEVRNPFIKVLIKNPKYVEKIKEIKSRYKTE